MTARQRSVFEYICRYIEKNGYAPSFKEIGAELGIVSTNGIKDHLDRLERKGYITRTAGRGRALQVCRQKPAVATAEATAISLEARLADAERRAEVAEMKLESARADVYETLAKEVEGRGILTGDMLAWIIREKAKEKP